MAPEMSRLAPMAWAMALARNDPRATVRRGTRAPVQRRPTHSITAISTKLAADKTNVRLTAATPQPAMAWLTAAKLSLWNSRHNTQIAAASMTGGTILRPIRTARRSRGCEVGAGATSPDCASTGGGAAGRVASGAVTAKSVSVESAVGVRLAERLGFLNK